MTTTGLDRGGLVRRGLRLEYLTVGWNLVEGVIAVAAALAAGSVALLGFGVDSFVESASGSVLIWRLMAERRAVDHGAVERIERLSQRLVAGALLALAAFIVLDATRVLWSGHHPESSTVGIIVTSVSLVVMWWLARAKRQVGIELGSRAMQADAFQTTACWWLSLVTLGGIGLNAALDWWWADPVAALGVAALVGREAYGAWQGDDCC